MWNFLIERWFDITLTVMFLGLEWYNHVKSERFEKQIDTKLKQIKEEVEYTGQLAYNREEEKFQDVK